MSKLTVSSPFSEFRMTQGEDPYYSDMSPGLFKGSTSQSAALAARSSPAERPRTLRRLKNVYDGPSGAGVPPASAPGAAPAPAPAPGVDKASGGDRERERAGSLSILSPFDEQEEWNKISEIMASFGTGLVRESVFVSELEKEFQNRLGLALAEGGSGSPLATSSVAHWLASLGLAEYEGLFRAHGYDHIDFLNGVLEDGDLREMGIDSERDRAALLTAAAALPQAVRDALAAADAVEDQARAAAATAAAAAGSGASSNGGDATPATPGGGDDAAGAGVVEEPREGAAVEAWLHALALDCYADTFRRHLYTDMSRVRRIWEVELTAVLEIGRVGHRRRILASVGSAPSAAPALASASARSNAPPDLDDLTHDLNQLKNNIQQLKEEIREKLPAPPPSSANGPAPSGTGTLRHSHKKSRPAPPPPPAAPATAAPEGDAGAGAGPANGELEIRGPSELLEGVPATLTTQWRHRPHSLVAGCVTYVANYLGSTVVKELRGTESTKKSIQKLKKSTKEAKSTPDIVLAISYRGVKFLNTLTQELVCEHEIRNIHCACQDADDLTHFAYITKDHASRSHYCHVFCVATMDQATEIILTLGQAFEVAYQLALRDQFAGVGGGGGGGRGANGGHARSQSACPVPGLPGGHPSHGLHHPQSHARSLSVNEIKLNGNGSAAPIALNEEL